MIDFKCPKCHEMMSVPDSLAGHSETCPSCGHVVIVPQPTPPAVQPAATAPQAVAPRPANVTTVNVEGTKATSGVGIAAQDTQTRVCEWCGESLAEKAIKCPHCHKLRKDIDRDRMHAYILLPASVLLFAIAASLLNKGWNAYSFFSGEAPWHEKVRVPPPLPHEGFSSVMEALARIVPEYRYHFSIQKFLGSLSGWFVIIEGLCAVLGFAGAIYYFRKLMRKTGRLWVF